ncbi:Rhodopsin [Trachymyrmex septentrionalis]|uniref:Rhodopsin n=1 Tax=Trachymyrmex septentrionalis TaxID=34720 RepID=A0A195EXT1_9HYME|nr:Rhodopsin [Trachymyrmex septentrionalis]
MLLTLKPDHKKHMLFLVEQSSPEKHKVKHIPSVVLQDFCKLALDYLQKGPNVKVYNAAAQKLDVELDVIKNSVEGLVNLLLESCKYKLSTEDFRDSIVALGFTEDKEAILSKLYSIKKDEVSDALEEIGFKLSRYHDMEWRFEVQTASRSLLKQVAPLISLDLSLKNPDNPEEIEHVLLQTDPTNLLHITQELEEALQESRSQHIRRISRAKILESLVTVSIENLTIFSENSTMAFADVLTRTIGPRAMQQIMSFNNKTVVDKVPPDMMYQFPPMDPMWHKILGLVMIVLGFMGWCGNGVVVYIFLMTPSLRTPSNLLVVNLAFSDFIMMIIMTPHMVINCYYETWVLGLLMCDIHAIVASLCGCASIWTMTAIALDKYNVIVKGMAGKPLTIKKALLEILIIWLFASIWAILPMVGWNRYVPEGNMTACGIDYLTKDWSSKSYILAVAAHERTMREQAKKMNVQSLRSGDNQNISAEAKLTKVALMTISLWFIAWTPYLVINYVGIFGVAKISPLFTIWGSLFAKANAIYNPIVYGISHPKYRAALKEKLPFFICGSTKDPSAAAKTAETSSTIITT